MKNNENDLPRTIMIAEDHDDTRFILARLFQMSGHRIIEAANGLEAINLAERERPDSIIIDLELPLLDGLSATRRIRAHASLRHIPIILISGHDTVFHHKQARAAGCSAFVTKPFEFDELESLIEQFSQDAVCA
ncbi:MAG: response regulator [Pyrinomonadaceae bacterium]